MTARCVEQNTYKAQHSTCRPSYSECSSVEYRQQLGEGEATGSADTAVARSSSVTQEVGRAQNREDGRGEAADQHEGADVHHDGAPRGQERHLQGTHLRQQGK